MFFRNGRRQTELAPGFKTLAALTLALQFFPSFSSQNSAWAQGEPNPKPSSELPDDSLKANPSDALKPVLPQSDEESLILSDSLSRDLGEQFSDAEMNEAARVYVTEQQQVVLDVLELATKLDEKKESLLAKLALEQMEHSKIDSDEYTDEQILEIGRKLYDAQTIKGKRIEEDLAIHIPGLGKAEPTSITVKIGREKKSYVFPRIVHERTGVCFLLIPSGLDLESPHMKKLIARIQVVSNSGKGRPVVVLSANHDDFHEKDGTLKFKLFSKPSSKSRQWWKTWWKANYVNPDLQSATLAVFSTIMQVGTTEAIAYLKYLNPEPGSVATWDHTASWVTAGFGMVFGLWGSFYNNITKPTSTTDKDARFKSMVTRMLISSASFAYILQIADHGLGSLNVFTTGAAWLTHLALWGNIIGSNYTRDKTRPFSDIREDMGLNKKELGSIGIKQHLIERNIVEQIPRTFKMLDQMGFNVHTMNTTLPVGKLMFYSMVYWGQWLVVKYARKVGYKDADKLEAKWEEFRSGKAVLKGIKDAPGNVMRVLGWGMRGVGRMLESVGEGLASCARALTGEKAPPKREADVPRDLVSDLFNVSSDGEWQLLPMKPNP